MIREEDSPGKKKLRRHYIKRFFKGSPRGTNQREREIFFFQRVQSSYSFSLTREKAPRLRWLVSEPHEAKFFFPTKTRWPKDQGDLREEYAYILGTPKCCRVTRLPQSTQKHSESTSASARSTENSLGSEEHLRFAWLDHLSLILHSHL